VAQRSSHAGAQGQFVGRCSTSRRAEEVIRAGPAQVGPQGGPAGFGVSYRRGRAGRAQDVERDAGQGDPGGVGQELPARGVGQRPVLQLSDDLLDDGVVPVGLIGRDGAQGGVGDEPMVTPWW